MIAIAKSKTARRCHRDHMPSREDLLRCHEFLPRLNLLFANYSPSRDRWSAQASEKSEIAPATHQGGVALRQPEARRPPQSRPRLEKHRENAQLTSRPADFC